MPSNIDYDRGVMKKSDPLTGVKVFMYLDQPGVYLNTYGTPVSEALAKSAGYDTELYAKQKLKKDLVAQAIDAIDAQVGAAEDFVPKSVAVAGGFAVQVANPFGGHIVLAPDGSKLTPYVMPKEAAMSLLKQLAPGIPVEDIEDKQASPEVRIEDLEPPKPKARRFADI